MGILSPIVNVFTTIYIFAWDFLLVIGNFVTPKKPPGKVVPEGHPGFGGKWPEYIPPKEGDSRSSCPGLNAMANHGILPRDGKNIPFVDLSHQTQSTYNFAPTFSFFLPNYAANFMKKDYKKDTFDLKDLDMHNKIEHDGSLAREDTHFEPDQSKIAVHLVKELLNSASGKDADGNLVLTSSDLAKALSQRLANCKATNPEFTTSLLHRLFGAGNASMMLSIFGGKIEDLRALLIEERLTDGWVPQNASRFGVTLGAFNNTAFGVIVRTKTVPPNYL